MDITTDGQIEYRRDILLDDSVKRELLRLIESDFTFDAVLVLN